MGFLLSCIFMCVKPTFSTGMNFQLIHIVFLLYFQGLITRTSEYLFEATNGQTYFRQVSILLPSNWANSNCTGESPDRHYQVDQEVLTATYQTSSSADIHVTADHPVYIDKPWTLQYGPCGVSGKKISIPISFITEEGADANNASVNPENLRARLMVREWVKFRYGVFDENGFAHDEKYPAEFVGTNGKVVPTACHLNRSTCNDPELCGDSATNARVHHHGHHHHHHHSHSKSQSSSDEQHLWDTSMMSLPLHNSVNEFCDERTHIRTTPTKHNFLCDGKSIWEVMKQHEDFKNMEESNNQQQSGPLTNAQPNGGGSGNSMESSTASGSTLRSIVSAPPPVFSFVTAKSHRILFLLDRSRSMNHNNRWSNLRRSLYRMFHHVPSGVELGVISYTNKSTVSLPLAVTTTHNRENLHGRIPVRPLTTETEVSCISCALKDAVKLIKSSNENVGPATVILVNGSPTKINNREWEKVMKIVENTPLRVIVITYEDDGLTDEDDTKQLVTLGRFGGIYKVTDQGTSGNHNLDQNEILSNVFIQIISENLGTPLNKVYDAVHWPDSEWQARGKFTIEDSLGRNTWVTVTTEESGDVDGLQLVSPSGKDFDLPLHAEGMMFLRIPGAAEAGTWSYTVKFFHNQSPRPVSVDVITESRKPESVSMKFWNQVVKQSMRQEEQSPLAAAIPATELPFVSQDSEEGDAEVVLLYAQVLQGDIPVLNANVTATITLPGVPRHGSNSISVKLLDTGSGDPDITWGDGIYSAYFTQLGPNPGLFTVSLQIDDNNGQAVVPVHTNITRKSYDKPVCCGTSVPHIATVPTGSFIRKIAGSSFYIENGVPLEEDLYPPGRVTDLRVERVIDSASEIKLSWTAPGGDYDKGKAARYEIRCYTSREALMNENFGTQGILVHSSLTPEPEEYGVRQSCTAAIPWANDYFYYGIVAIDSSHNRGKVSNLVSVFIKETPTSTIKMSNAWEDDALVSNLTSSRSINKGNGVFQAGASWFRGLSELELYLVLGGAAIFLILISVFILLLVCVKKRGASKTSEAPPSYHNIYTQSNGKGGASPNSGKDGITCCWENESNHTDQKPVSQSNQKSSMNGNYITSSVSSYIPASALCSPVQNGSVYRDMYAGSASTQHTHTHDSSSVDSKPSDQGSNETVQISDNLNGPTPFYVQNPTSPSSRMPPINVPFDPMSIGGLSLGHGLNGLHHSNNISLLSQPNHNNLSRDSTYLTKNGEYNASDDDEGGFRAQRRDNLDGLHHKTVPMPTASDYDSPSVMNGSTYGGSVISLPNSNKKRTRHISFV
ncbi:unnamed protein product [Orchesella dallaii]|uniref:VWFA domain-containing protein n=1 Tax=Orchesella dallaii TaxID=48710 RepID=A0ABP1QG95_9HEXA